MQQLPHKKLIQSKHLATASDCLLLQAVHRGAPPVPLAVVTFMTLPLLPNKVWHGLPLPLPITPGPPPPPPPEFEAVLDALLEVLPQPLRPLLDSDDVDEAEDAEDEADDVLEADDDTEAEMVC